MNLCNNPLEIRETAIIFDEFQRNLKESQKKLEKWVKMRFLFYICFKTGIKKIDSTKG